MPSCKNIKIENETLLLLMPNMSPSCTQAPTLNTKASIIVHTPHLTVVLLRAFPVSGLDMPNNAFAAVFQNKAPTAFYLSKDAKNFAKMSK